MNQKLSKKQQRQITNKKQEVIVNFEKENLDNLKPGIVISRFGNQADIEDTSGKVFRCGIRKNIRDITTGDNILWKEDSANSDFKGIIEFVYDRISELLRPDFYDGLKPVAANITKIFIVTSILPELSTNIIDRYIVACEEQKIKPIIVVNKIDMLTTDSFNNLKCKLEIYTNLGYKVIYISTKTNVGIDELKEEIANQQVVLVGQSGVGKSSIVNSLSTSPKAQTNVVSEISGLGQHTTTVSKLYHIDENGIIIDSPGIREFALWNLSQQQIAFNFIEFRKYIGSCKYKDCKHINEKGCSIIEAVDSNDIFKERYENYVKILSTINLQLQKNKTRRANTNKKGFN